VSPHAGRLLFGDFPVDFPVSVGTAVSYADAKDPGSAAAEDDEPDPGLPGADVVVG